MGIKNKAGNLFRAFAAVTLSLSAAGFAATGVRAGDPAAVTSSIAGIPATPVESKTWPGTISRFETQAPYFALTIDDCYSPTYFTQMVDDLDEAGAKATFFCSGEALAVQESVNPGITRRLVQNGNRIGYHTMRLHDLDVGELAKVPSSEYDRDYAQWTALMKRYLGDLYDEGVVPYARAPYGLFNGAFTSFCERNGLEMFYWSGDGYTLMQLEGSATPKDDGSIILLHSRYLDAQQLEEYLAAGKTESIAPTSLSCMMEGKACTDANAYLGIPAAPESEPPCVPSHRRHCPI